MVNFTHVPDFVVAVARSTGILLDPTYTGKAANGLLKELTNNPHRFRGRRILFLHTGILWCIIPFVILTILIMI